MTSASSGSCLRCCDGDGDDFCLLDCVRPENHDGRHACDEHAHLRESLDIPIVPDEPTFYTGGHIDEPCDASPGSQPSPRMPRLSSGPWEQADPFGGAGRWWQARATRTGRVVAQVIIATDGQGYDWSIMPYGATTAAGWRHDARGARNTALAQLRAAGLTTPDDEPDHAAEAPTATPEPTTGAASPVRAGEAVTVDAQMRIRDLELRLDGAHRDERLTGALAQAHVLRLTRERDDLDASWLAEVNGALGSGYSTRVAAMDRLRYLIASGEEAQGAVDTIADLLGLDEDAEMPAVIDAARAAITASKSDTGTAIASLLGVPPAELGDRIRRLIAAEARGDLAEDLLDTVIRALTAPRGT